MSQHNTYENLCKQCYIKIMKPTKKEIKKIVMSEYNECCDNCNRNGPIVEYIEDGD